MLRRKMIRDIRQNLSQFITILLMVFIGIMAYSGIESYMEGMKETANNFYGDYNLQDLNVMGELSEENINTIKEISNVKNAEGKLNVNGVLQTRDRSSPNSNRPRLPGGSTFSALLSHLARKPASTSAFLIGSPLSLLLPPSLWSDSVLTKKASLLSAT